MSSPLSIRFDPDVLERLRRRAREIPGATPSGLAQRLVDEGLRMAEHPGIVFKDGPAGRRPALRVGPDVWELIKYLREIPERGQAAIDRLTKELSLSESQVRAALDYYAAYSDEIDADIIERDRYAEAAYQAWVRQQELLG
jgi:hypothetical protein